MIEKQIRPRIDKPTIYKVIKSLLSDKWIKVHHHAMGRMVKYYQATPGGLQNRLLNKYGEKGEMEKLVALYGERSYWKRWIPEEDVLRMLSKNPELTPGNEWIEIVQSLEPQLRKYHPDPEYPFRRVPEIFQFGPAWLFIKEFYPDGNTPIEEQVFKELVRECFVKLSMAKILLDSKGKPIHHGSKLVAKRIPVSRNDCLEELREILRRLEKYPQYRTKMLTLLKEYQDYALHEWHVANTEGSVIKTILDETPR